MVEIKTYKQNLKLEAALKYLKMGLNIIPTGANKVSLIKWEPYQSRLSTVDEINSWWKQWPNANPALVTGKVSGVVALDLDKKHNRTSKEFVLPLTPCAKSGNGGEHFFFKYPENVSVKSGSAISGEGVDCRGEPGYILLPPSVNESGGQYEWTVPLESKDDLADMPDWFLKLMAKDEKADAALWQRGSGGVKEGSRNETAASMAGKLITSLAPELRETVGWPGYMKWNESNTPPLLVKELREVWESILKYESDDNMLASMRKTQTELLIEMVEKKNNFVLFHDDKMESYIRLKNGDHNEIMSLKSRAIRRLLIREFWKAKNKAIAPDSVKNAIAVLDGRACYDGPEHKLQNRMAWKDKELWYDMADAKWRAIKINENGWEIVNEPPILFNRYSHSQAQIVPQQKNGNIKLFLNYVNISDPDQQLLLLVYLISCFIPDFPHAILVILGSHGSAKSTLSKLLRRIVDPSFIEVASFPDSHRELVQALAHHPFLFFDNVSFVSEEVSDILCKATTGSGFVKRELYSDDDDIIYSFKRSIGLNGINLVTTRPDLLDRSILLELEMIDESHRKQEKELMDNFEKDLPSILGGVFDTIVKTLKIKPTIQLATSPRMADFASWGAAIAEALGYTKEKFLSVYQENIEKQKETILNENMVALTLISFMEEYSQQRWEGTMTELLHKLTEHANFADSNITKDKYWPKAPNMLSRALNTLRVTLRDVNILITISAGKKRKVTIEKTLLPEAYLVIPPVTSSMLPEDDADDTSGVSEDF
jgi:hypothetical protein